MECQIRDSPNHTCHQFGVLTVEYTTLDEWIGESSDRRDLLLALGRRSVFTQPVKIVVDDVLSDERVPLNLLEDELQEALDDLLRVVRRADVRFVSWRVAVEIRSRSIRKSGKSSTGGHLRPKRPPKTTKVRRFGISEQSLARNGAVPRKTTPSGPRLDP